MAGQELPAVFRQTAAPSILSFYPALGVKRDVRSQPELSNYALRGLLSVRYLLTTLAHQKQFHAEADEAGRITIPWTAMFSTRIRLRSMGFTYDYYLTETQYEDTVTPTRSNLLMRHWCSLRRMRWPTGSTSRPCPRQSSTT